YWKNHPNAWPVSSLTIGAITYTEAELITILQTAPKSGDATIILIHQLIAAKLNIASGADNSAVASTITMADTYLQNNALKSRPLGKAKTQGTTLAQTLDNYNSGLIGPGHCSDETSAEMDMALD